MGLHHQKRTKCKPAQGLAVFVVLSIVILQPLRLMGQQQAKVLLIMQSTPGGAQVTVDAKPMGTTDQQGRLRLSLNPGKHSLCISLAGYRDWNGSATLISGQTAFIRTALTVRRNTAQRDSATSHDAPSLDDTLTFVAGKLATYPVQFYTGTRSDTVARRRGSSLTHSECTISLQTESHEYVSDHDAYGRSQCSVSLNKVALPIEIKNVDETREWGEVTGGSPNYYHLVFRTQLDEPVIRCSNHFENPLPDNPNTSDSTTTNSSAWVVVSDQDVAKRIANAIAHAVQLCGGGAKKEPF